MLFTGVYGRFIDVDHSLVDADFDHLAYLWTRVDSPADFGPTGVRIGVRL
jgi:hypothetical protein